MGERFHIAEPENNKSYAEMQEEEFRLRGGHELSAVQKEAIDVYSRELKDVKQDPDGGLNEKVSGAPTPIHLGRSYETPE